MHPALAEQAHRPWPVPQRPWLLRQTWHDLLFLHWPVPAAELRPLVPEPLAIDEHQGSAWVAVTPFWMSGIGVREWPRLPVASQFDELNVRTYVRFGDRPGVWFFSLDAGSRLGVMAARILYGLPYGYARMRHLHRGEEIIYRSERSSKAGFAARYGPVGPVTPAEPGTPEHWLTERYCLYVRRESGLYRAEIHHAPWPLQPARAALNRNDMLRVNHIAVEEAPALLHFSRRLDVVVWSLERVT